MRIPFRTLLAFVCLLFLSLGLHAQTGPDVIDVRPYTPLSGSSMESVSEMNGSLNVDLPIWSIPQRGALKLDFHLGYDVPTYLMNYDCPTTVLAPDSSSGNSASGADAQPDAVLPSGCNFPLCTGEVNTFCEVTWDLAVDDSVVSHFGFGEGIRILSSTDVVVSPVEQMTTTTPSYLMSWYWVVHTPDGGSHSLALTTNGDYRTVDGTGWQYLASSCTLRDAQGTTYQFACQDVSSPDSLTIGHAPGRLLYEEDTNGNRITLNYNDWTDASGFAEHTFAGWTDTLGRSVPPIPQYASAVGTGAPDASCPAGSTASGTWLPPNSTLPLRICAANIALQTDLATTTPFPPASSPLASHYHDYSDTLSMISGIVLPSGDKWAFGYLPQLGDPEYGTNVNYGELREIDFPTGGTIRYRWNHQKQIRRAPLTSLARSYVTERQIQSSANAQAAVWQYSLPAGFQVNLAGTDVVSTTVIDPNGNIQIISFDTNDTPSLYPTARVHQDANHNTVLTEITDYIQVAPDPTGSNLASFAAATGPTGTAFPWHKTTIWPDGQQKETVYTYADTIPFQAYYSADGPIYLTNGQETSEQEYDYGSGASGNLLSTKTTTYWARSHPDYFTQNLISLPASVTTTDVSTGHQQITTYAYDESARTPGNAPSASNGITIWDANPPNGSIRGNLTSQGRYADSTNSFVTTTLSYNDTGTVASLSLPTNGSLPDTATTYGWSANFNGALLTSKTAIIGTQNQTNTYDYDPTTFLLKTKTDPNSATTTYTYYPDQRLHTVTLPPNAQGDHGETEYRYPSPNEVDSRTRQASGWLTHQDLYDGLGRKITSKLLGACSNGSDITVDTTYDLLDRVLTESNPYCPGASETSANGITIHGTSTTANDGYDALGRPLILTEPDGSTQRWSYNDDTTTFTDENNSTWTRTSDALGRLTSVAEPNGAVTNYTYNAFGDLLSVNQPGLAGETTRFRIFTYDSLSRLITASNPETGTICYGQWSGTACTGGYDNHGNLLYKTDANGVVLSYTYDALNRLTFKGASDGTVNDAYYYDQWPGSIGRLTTANVANVAGNGFYYDLLGRVVGVSYSAPGSNSWQPGMGAKYDLAGNLTELDYPSGRVVTNTYDSAGRLSKVSSGGIDYISGPANGGIAYWPSGTEQSFTLGNGVTQTNVLNSRLQPCHTYASSPVLPTPTAPLQGNVFDRASFFSATPSTNCGSEPGNNGNIYSIVDNLNPGRTQSFSYDAFNRLATAFRSDGAYNHTYHYDSFGNLLVEDHADETTFGQLSIDPATNRLLRTINGNAAYTYDPAGNLISNGPTDTCAPGSNGVSGPCGHTFQYNALSQLHFVDNGNTASYGYYATDERAVKITATGWTDYVYLNGTPYTEHDNNGIWTDYIYANGQKIAKAVSSQPVYQFKGTRGGDDWQCGTAGTLNTTALPSSPSPGDHVAFDMLVPSTSAPVVGGMWITLNGVGSDMTAPGQTGSDSLSPADGLWHHYVYDIPSGNLSTLGINLQQSTGYGDWEIDYANIVYIKSDGTLLPLFTGNGTMSVTLDGGILSSSPHDNCASNNITGTITSLPVPADEGTTYYLDDKLGTGQVELSNGGVPLWQGQFTPFGAELPDGPTSMHYKFTGKETDAESGLDYFGARYYGSIMGRWLSPDWSAKATPIPYATLDNPQSLNLYGYVANNPLRSRDIDGHRQVCAPDTSRTEKDGSLTIIAGKCHEEDDGFWGGVGGLLHALNPWGKLGGPAHRATVNKIGEMLQREGFEVQKEVPIKIPEGGVKGTRYVDVVGHNNSTGETRMYQVGNTNKDGSPISREVKALDDIEKATGMRPEFEDKGLAEKLDSIGRPSMPGVSDEPEGPIEGEPIEPVEIPLP